VTAPTPEPEDNDVRKFFVAYHQPSLLLHALRNAIPKRAPDLNLLSTAAIDPATTPVDMILLTICDETMDLDALLKPFEPIRSAQPQVPVVAVLSACNSSDAAILIERNVKGIITADSTIDITVAALRFALAGGAFAPPKLVHLEPQAQQTVATVKTLRAETLELTTHNETSFTPREIEVLHRLRQGLQNKIIAYELGISESTVKVHLRNVMKKLHASNRTQVAFMLRRLPHLNVNGATSREYTPQ
jgi:DNA-binding NarL/FixJ family response regulator